MSESMGVIYYEVDVDTGKLVNSTGAMDKSLDGLQKEFDKTDRQAGKFTGQMNKVAEGVKRANAETQGATSSINGLYKVLAGLVSLRAANSLIEMAESYNTYAERVRMATASQAEFEMVQRRLLDTANGTYRALSEAQEVYIRTADGLRDMGYSTEQALDITDSLSYAFVKNEASVDRANAAINAYSKSINKGRVDAQAWESIIAAVPTVINDIAEASGRSAQEVRRLGAEGRITARDLNEGLRKSLDANRDAAEGMATTVEDALTNLKNNLSAYLGEANQATGATAALSSTIVALGDNIDTLVNLLVAAGAGALANFIARTGMAAIESAKAAMAARAQAVEELKLAQAHAQVTAQALRHAQANAGLMGTVGALTAAENAHSQALMRVASAQRAVTTVGGSLLRILGGPIGLVSLAVSAATGMYMFRDSNNDVRKSILDLNQPMDALVKQFRELGDAQRELALIQWGEELDKSVKTAGKSLFELNQALRQFGGRAIYEFGEARAAGEDLLPVLDNLISQGVIPESDRSRLVEIIAGYQQAAGAAEQYKEQISSLREENKKLSQQSDSGGSPTLSEDGAEAEKRLQSMRNEVELLRRIGIEREKLKAIQALGADASPAQKAEAESLVVLIAQLEAEEEAREAIKKAREDDSRTLSEMSRKLQEAALSGEELARAKARQSLSEWADPEDVKRLEEMASALWQMEESERKRRSFGETSSDAWQNIRGDVSPLSGGMFDDQTERYRAEADAEKRRYEESLARLKEARQLGLDIGRDYNQAEEELAKEHSRRMEQIEKARKEMSLRQSADAFGQMASDLGAYIDEYGSKNKDLMRTMKAAAIAQTIIQTYLGAQQAFTALSSIPIVGPALGAAAAAAAIAGGMARVSAIRSQQVGGRQYGGPVAAGSMYRVNENGRPEVFKASNGQQFMIPNSRGEVISNKDAAGGGSTTVVNLNIVESQDRGGEVERMDGPNGDVTITAFVADIRRDGPASRALSQTFGLTRRGK